MKRHLCASTRRYMR